MERLFKPKRVSEILKKYNFRFSKTLGQNFLIDGNIVRKIVDSAEVSEADNVLEIGPGIGTLTEELALRAKKVVSIEIDKRLKDLLEETLPHDNVKIIYKDFLKLDLKTLIDEEFKGQNFKVVANLPYYITTPIIEKLLLNCENIEIINVMIQKEVAKRFTAQPQTKDYGSLSVFIQFFCKAFYEFTVPRTVFMPKPNVDSGVCKLEVKRDLPNIDREEFFKIVRAAFSKRRKTLVNSLSQSQLNLDKNKVTEILELSGIDTKRRAESLTLEDFLVLYVNVLKFGGFNGWKINGRFG